MQAAVAEFAAAALATSTLARPSGARPPVSRLTANDLATLHMTLIRRVQDEHSRGIATARPRTSTSVGYPCTSVLTAFGVAALAHCSVELDSAVAFVEGRGYMGPREEGSPIINLAACVIARTTGTVLPALCVAAHLLHDVTVAQAWFPAACDLLRKLDHVCTALPDTVAAAAVFNEVEARAQAERVSTRAPLFRSRNGLTRALLCVSVISAMATCRNSLCRRTWRIMCPSRCPRTTS
jgi:hypothetical protein